MKRAITWIPVVVLLSLIGISNFLSSQPTAGTLDGTPGILEVFISARVPTDSVSIVIDLLETKVSEITGVQISVERFEFFTLDEPSP
jgi:hypothetical protein